MTRLFVAVALDDAARAACAGVAERLRAKGFPGRWVPPENYHLTIAFLGGVEDERVDGVAQAMRRAASRLDPFAVPLDAVGGFPDTKRARVAWTGPAKPVRALARGNPGAPLPAAAAPQDVAVAVDALSLFASRTGPDGARYEALARAGLGTAN